MFVSQSEKNILKTITKSSPTAGKVDINQDKNVSPQAIISFKTKGKINDFESLLENELFSLCYSAKLAKLDSN